MAERADVVLVGDSDAVRSVVRELRRGGRAPVVLESVAAARPCCGSWEVEADGRLWFVRSVVVPGDGDDPRSLLRAICDDLDRPRPGLG
jgi:hypothetical protein